ncbi:hypothetical protein HPB50_018463 [Hyalomma asiaticum]|uniref:Uncharacterized protein n=1 Tax=Hyalomma asiaticum TaxID=266040 RepID=A0ACB7TLY0_HYAAI|nr:hypothetical protein HPB50_018463 [Hyalomma asiaticum]
MLSHLSCGPSRGLPPPPRALIYPGALDEPAVFRPPLLVDDTATAGAGRAAQPSPRRRFLTSYRQLLEEIHPAEYFLMEGYCALAWEA